MRWASVLAACACLSGQQTDEIRVSAHVYSPPQLRLTTQATLVQLDAVVRDPRGRAVSGLKQGDFEVLDEGKPREIAAFSMVTREGMRASDPPAASSGAPYPQRARAHAETPIRSTLLFFDDPHGSPGELQRAQLAAREFVKAGPGPGAQSAVYSASAGLTLDFTADPEAVTAGIGKLHSHQRVSENGLQPCPRITSYQAYLIVYNDLDALNAAVQEAQQCLNAVDTSAAGVLGRSTGLTSLRNANPTVVAVKAQASATWEQAHTDSQGSFDAVGKALTVLSKAPGTRVLLMASTGFLSGRMDSEKTEAIDRAIRNGIVLNALDAKGLWSEAPGRQSETVGALPTATFLFETSGIGSRNDAVNNVMAEFASGTGGLFFHNSNDLVGGFSQLGAAPETTYQIAFHPETNSPAGQYHKLKVRLTFKGSDYVQTRPGYVTPTSAPAAAQPELRPIDRETMASDVLTAIPIHLTVKAGRNEKGDTMVSTSIHVELTPLQFTQRDDRHTQKLVFIAVLLDSVGRIVAAKEGEMDLALTTPWRALRPAA
jgi:VWFA-related protein